LSSPAKPPKRVGCSRVRSVIVRAETSSEEASAWFVAEKTPAKTGGASSLLLLLVQLVLTDSESAEETTWWLVRLLTCSGLTEDYQMR
jgi:hypothetical protein